MADKADQDRAIPHPNDETDWPRNGPVEIPWDDEDEAAADYALEQLLEHRRQSGTAPMFSLTANNPTAISIKYFAGGRLEGPAGVVQLIEHLATRLDGRVVGPLGGPYTQNHHLKSPYSAWVIMGMVLGWDAKMTGSLPMRPPVPPGAIP